jgi:mRNA interferase MazF
MVEVKSIQSGDIWDAVLDPIRGHEQGGFRPVIIVSGNWFNEIANGMMWMVPVTRTYKGFPSHIELAGPDSGLTSTSYAMCEQIRSISHERLKRKRGSIDVSTLELLRAAIRQLIVD